MMMTLQIYKTITYTILNSNLGLINLTYMLDILTKYIIKISFCLMMLGPIIMKIILLIFGFLLLFYFVLSILYFLISKIHWISNNQNKNFEFIDINKFFNYIIKYTIIIIIVNLIYTNILLKLIILPLQELNFNSTFEYNYLFISWIFIIIIFYTLIYLWSKNLFSVVKKHIYLYIYRWGVFIILRSIICIFCPVEYSEYLSLGLLLVIFPDIFSEILNYYFNLVDLIMEKIPKDIFLAQEAYAEGENENPTFKEALDEMYKNDENRRNIKNYPEISKDHHKKKNAPQIPWDIVTRMTIIFYVDPVPSPVFKDLYAIMEIQVTPFDRTKLCIMVEADKMIYTLNQSSLCSEVSLWSKCPSGVPKPEGYLKFMYKISGEDYYKYEGEYRRFNYLVNEDIGYSRGYNFRTFVPSDFFFTDKQIKWINRSESGEKTLVSLGWYRGRPLQGPVLDSGIAEALKTKYKTACFYKND